MFRKLLIFILVSFKLSATFISYAPFELSYFEDPDSHWGFIIYDDLKIVSIHPELKQAFKDRFELALKNNEMVAINFLQYPAQFIHERDLPDNFVLHKNVDDPLSAVFNYEDLKYHNNLFTERGISLKTGNKWKKIVITNKNLLAHAIKTIKSARINHTEVEINLNILLNPNNHEQIRPEAIIKPMGGSY